MQRLQHSEHSFALIYAVCRCLRNVIVFLPLPQSANGKTFCSMCMPYMCTGLRISSFSLRLSSFRLVFVFSFFPFVCLLYSLCSHFLAPFHFVISAIVLIRNLLQKRSNILKLCIPCLVLQWSFNAYASSYSILA